MNPKTVSRSATAGARSLLVMTPAPPLTGRRPRHVQATNEETKSPLTGSAPSGMTSAFRLTNAEFRRSAQGTRPLSPPLHPVVDTPDPGCDRSDKEMQSCNNSTRICPG